MCVYIYIYKYIHTCIYYSALQRGSPYFQGLRLLSEPHRHRSIELHGVMQSGMWYLQFVPPKEDGWSSPSANLHAATGKA